MGIEFDDSRWPLVVVRYGDFTEAEYAEVPKMIERWLAKKEVFGIVNDTSRGGMPSATQRKLAADFFDREQAALNTWVAAWANVIPSAVVRGAITAISWLTTPPFPFQNVSDVASAEKYVREAIAKRR